MPTPCDPRPTVLLRHELPDGTSHVDWMIAQDPRGAAPLMTFRMEGRVDGLEPDGDPGRLAAERIGDHRPAYLTYEGPVGGGRGTVGRLRRGDVIAFDETPDACAIDVIWAASEAARGPVQRLRLSRNAGSRWHVRAV